MRSRSAAVRWRGGSVRLHSATVRMHLTNACGVHNFRLKISTCLAHKTCARRICRTRVGSRKASERAGFGAASTTPNPARSSRFVRPTCSRSWLSSPRHRLLGFFFEFVGNKPPTDSDSSLLSASHAQHGPLPQGGDAAA